MDHEKMNKNNALRNRREFLQAGLVTGLTLPFIGCRNLVGNSATKGPLFTSMGINALFTEAPAVAAAGADFLLQSTRGFLRPHQSEAEFEKQLRLLDQSPIPVKTCNSFLTDGPLRSVGPEAKHENVLKYANTAFKRAKRAGVERIVFGSSSSRKRPEGWSKAQADAQFIPLLKQMGDLAAAQGVVVAVENLQAQECNYLTTISEVAEIVEAVDHPNIRLLADIYHSTAMKEDPSVFGKYAHLTNMVEIAELKGRSVPGVHGQDFRPYFNALRKAGYQGPIEVEARWKVDQVAEAFATIRKQSKA